MGKCIGIDLGTTNSVAAVRMATAQVLQNRESQDLTRSVVGEYKGQIRVGQLALDQQLLAPKDTIESIKRLMGRGFRDENVQRVKSRAAYAIVEPTDGTDDDVRVLMGGKPFSPIQISSMILKKVKEDAEMRLNDTVEYAVITVPAYFTDKQKDATRKAGQLAGLKVQKVLDEPTAAALAFGVDNVGPDDSKTILVYDLGGGTFDVSVMTIVSGAFVQLNIEGDMWLGGDDFDRKLMDHVLRHVKMVYGIDGATDPKFMVELKKKAEQAKKALSSMTRTDITIPGMLKSDAGDLIDVELEISRSEFEALISSDVARSMEIVHKAIRNAGEAMTPEQIDHVLLVGGSSYIPLVQSSLAAIFGRQKLMMNVDPMKCVAYGAAILSAKWAEKVECPNGHPNPGKNIVCESAGCGLPLASSDGIIVAPGVTPMHYGIRTRAKTVRCPRGHENSGQNRKCQVEGCSEAITGADDCFEVIIPKGSSYPTPDPVPQRFTTPAPNLKRLRVPIYAGLDPVASKNELQATIWLELPQGVREATPVEVAFSLDDDGILKKVQVKLLDGSGTQIETYLDRGSELRSRIEQRLDQLKRKKDESREELDPEKERRWEELYAEATRALSANNAAAAGQCAGNMEQLLSDGDAAWKKKAQGLCGYTDAVLDYSFLLDPPKTQQLKTMMRELQSCIDRNDEVGAASRFEDLDKATDDLPGAVLMLMRILRAISVATEKGLLADADRIRAARNQIEAALRANEWDRALEQYRAIEATVDKVFGADKKSQSFKATRGEDYLGGSK
ncbi:MAG: Hsp70 family protein [Terracidiphilus sp.]